MARRPKLLIRLVASVGIAAAMGLAALTLWPPGEELPSRADCIQRIDIQDIDPAHADDYDDLVFRFLSGERLKIRDFAPGAGFGQDRTKFYVWFSQQCDRKMALLQPAVDAFNARHGEVATLSLHPGRVEPGPDTVMFGGPHWKPE